MQRRTEMYPRAWIAHHRLQWGRNWPRVSHIIAPPREKSMDNGK